MIFALLLGAALITLNVMVQAYGNMLWLKALEGAFKQTSQTHLYRRTLKLLVSSFLFFTVLHTLQTLTWALAYWNFPETGAVFISFAEAWYFSMVTFTTLGYGDVTLLGDWRLLSGIEAINGIMLIGWSTAMMFSLIQQVYKNLNSGLGQS